MFAWLGGNEQELRTMILYPNQQNGIYADGSLPSGFSNRCVSISGGRLGWGSSHDPERVLGMTGAGVRSFLRRFFPDPKLYAGMTLIADMEHPFNPGTIAFPKPGELQALAHAMDVRYIEMKRYFGNTVRVLAWCSGTAWQNEPNWKDYLDTATLVELARLGAFYAADGFAMRVYPPAGSDTIRTRFEKGRRVYQTSTRIGDALCRAAADLDGRKRATFLQASLEQFGDDGRPGQDPLPPEDVVAQIQWAKAEGHSEIGFWSATDTLASGLPVADLLRRAGDLMFDASAGNAGGADALTDDQVVELMERQAPATAAVAGDAEANAPASPANDDGGA